MVTRYFLPDSTLAILSKGATLEYDTDKYGKANREVNMSGKIYFSVRRNALSPFIVATEYAQVKVLGTEFEVTECRKDTATRVYVKSGKLCLKGDTAKMELSLQKICVAY